MANAKTIDDVLNAPLSADELASLRKLDAANAGELQELAIRAVREIERLRAALNETLDELVKYMDDSVGPSSPSASGDPWITERRKLSSGDRSIGLPISFEVTGDPLVQIAPGLYRLHWKSGGFSLAAVGMLHDGTRWFAPVNWTSATGHGSISSGWSMVRGAECIDAGPLRSDGADPTA